MAGVEQLRIDANQKIRFNAVLQQHTKCRIDGQQNKAFAKAAKIVQRFFERRPRCNQQKRQPFKLAVKYAGIRSSGDMAHIHRDVLHPKPPEAVERVGIDAKAVEQA